MSVTLNPTVKHDDLNLAARRTQLFRHLDTILDVAMKKYSMEKKGDTSRLKWGRLAVQGIQAYGSLLQTAEIETLAQEIEAIKHQLGVVKP